MAYTARSGDPGPRCCGFLKIRTFCVIRVTGLDAAYVMDLALEHDCVVDVFDLGLDIYTNDFESPEAGWQGRVKFHRCRVFKNTQPPLSPIPPLLSHACLKIRGFNILRLIACEYTQGRQ
jgi:hypothetical protein